MEFLRLLAWLFLWSLVAYAPFAAIARLIDYWHLKRFSPRVPVFSEYALYHGLSILTVALFNPILCFIVVGQIYVALGFSSATGFDGSFDYLLTMWLFSLALPLQLHYTVTASRVRNLETNELQPRGVAILWALGSFVSTTMAWVVFWLLKPAKAQWPWDLLGAA
ncbi:MAG: hypothetical protein KDB07_03615 [Planctomycetes bacterium]|nr:hypothetical protein [Planctomycetota bacterium]